MPIRNTPLVPGEFYHVYNRGNSRQAIYRAPGDYGRFLALLYLANSTDSFVFRDIDSDKLFESRVSEPLVAIGAYCLMPNHFHILLTPLLEGGAATFMGKLATGYSMYFNKKHHRTGSLFEGRFKSEHVDSDNYLKYLFSYIHLNPVKLIQPKWQEEGITNLHETFCYLDEYQYSSYVDNRVERPQSNILSREKFPEYFATKQEYDTEMKEWLTYNNELVTPETGTPEN